MFYVYLLKTLNGQLYIGYSSNLKRRIQEHQRQTVRTTSRLGYGNLIYYEAYDNEAAAQEREKKLKQFGSAYHGLIKRLGLRN